MNDYWLDKRAKIDQIEVPAYVLASYSTMLHLPGSLRGFTDIPHKNKWFVFRKPETFCDLTANISPPGFEYTLLRNGTTSISKVPTMSCSYFSIVTRKTSTMNWRSFRKFEFHYLGTMW